ncbi:MAG TPA: hypothetical protein VG722_11975 [Tepidisphaeraceae bacterium]|nr:hypothetical protein [Tepidisphaeraceae bacterium]
MAPKKRLILLLLALLVTIIAGFVSISAYLYTAVPAFYSPRHLTPEQTAVAAQAAEEKVISVRNWAEHEEAIESARLHHVATRPIEDLHVSVTDTQINAFFRKWKDVLQWDRIGDPYVSNPTLAIIGDHIVLAGEVRQMHAIVSLVFTAKLDEHGELVVRLRRVLAGRLTLPSTLWMAQRHRVVNAVEDALPRWKREARMRASGAANSAGVAVAMSRLLLCALSNKPVDPVLFLPVDDRTAIPAKIDSIDIGDGRLSLKLEPMSEKERTEYWDRLIHSTGVAESF